MTSILKVSVIEVCIGKPSDYDKKGAPDSGNIIVLEFCTRNGLNFSLFEASMQTSCAVLIKLERGASLKSVKTLKYIYLPQSIFDLELIV